VPRPADSADNEFQKIRVGSIPGGAQKICDSRSPQKITRNGTLCAMQGISALRKTNSLKKKVQAKGATTHVGAAYYPRYTKQQPFKALEPQRI